MSRYTLETGEKITGVPAAQIQSIAETMAKNRPGTILYALGMTQHTTGVQGIRGFTILQLLLGNLGKPGSGVNALRGEPNVQGACDMGVLNNYLPGYMDYPSATEPTLEAYTKKNGTGDRRFLVNMLKAFYGDAATPENDFCYAWLPKKAVGKNYGTMQIFEEALAGKLKMLWIVGQNPAVTTPNLNLTFAGMDKIETLIVQEIWDTETANFWKRPGADPKSIQTEVFLLPASFFMEKNGTISNSGGLIQWRNAAVKPPGTAKPDGEIVDYVFRRVRDLVHDTRDPKDDPIKKAFWTYLSAEDVLKEMNGFALVDLPDAKLKKGDLVTKVADLKPDGTTSSGVWLYAGVFAGGVNLSKRRDSQTDPGGLGIYPGFAWTWPNNMRVLYNRASCDRNGKPYPGSKPIVWWDEKAGRWAGYDLPDVPKLTDGPSTPNGCRAFHMSAEGVGRLFAAVYKDPDEKADRGQRRSRQPDPARRRLRAQGRPAAGDVRARREPGRELPPPEGRDQPDLEVPAREVAPADRHRGQVSLRPHDVDGRRALVRRLLDAQHPVVERARPRAHDGDPREPRTEALGQVGRLGEGLLGARPAHGQGRGDAAHEADQGGRQGSHDRLDALQLGVHGAFAGRQRELPDDRRRGPRRRHPGDQGLPRQRGEGVGAARSGAGRNGGGHERSGRPTSRSRRRSSTSPTASAAAPARSPASSGTTATARRPS